MMRENNKGTLIRDLTQGSVTKLLLVFSFPLMCSNLLQTVYNMVDMVVIGQFVGKEGLSAVSIGGDILHFLTFLVMGLANAGQVILSQYIGAGNRDRVKGTIGTMFTATLFCAVVLFIICLFGLDPLLRLLNTPEEAFESAHRYGMTCVYGIFFIYGYNLVSAILRGMGDSKHPFIFVAVATVVNLVLDLVFVAGLKMGAFGAAFATVIGQGVSFIWAIAYLYRRRDDFGFDFRLSSFKPDGEILPKLIKLGFPMILQSAAINFSMMFVNSYINAYGVVACAVTGIGNKLASITAVITNALSTAGSSMVGQNLGAERYDRIPKIIGVSLVIDMVFALLLSALTILFPREIFGLFDQDPEVLDMAMTYVPVAVLLFIGFGMRSPLFALINGSGNARLNLVVGMMDGVICRIGLAMLLGLVFDMGIMGFWLGNAFAGYMPFVIGGVYFITGKWKTHKLIK
ncbi:MAG: MATE family efflux transporter [Oscillospiraceae bacterium]|nr:MATE family efflux transporter [Oscillospiraceae bacterium]